MCFQACGSDSASQPASGAPQADQVLPEPVTTTFASTQEWQSIGDQVRSAYVSDEAEQIDPEFKTIDPMLSAPQAIERDGTYTFELTTEQSVDPIDVGVFFPGDATDYFVVGDISVEKSETGLVATMTISDVKNAYPNFQVWVY